jgi:hypothetical protein
MRRAGNWDRDLKVSTPKKEVIAMTKMTTIPENYKNVRAGIIELLKAARSAAARNVNSIMTAVYWDIGRRIVQFEQGGENRAEYGEQLIQQLSGDLTRQFGRGFGRANLWQMRAFFRTWPEAKILQTSASALPMRSLRHISFRPKWVAYSSRVLRCTVSPDHRSPLALPHMDIAWIAH